MSACRNRASPIQRFSSTRIGASPRSARGRRRRGRQFVPRRAPPPGRDAVGAGSAARSASRRLSGSLLMPAAVPTARPAGLGRWDGSCGSRRWRRRHSGRRRRRAAPGLDLGQSSSRTAREPSEARRQAGASGARSGLACRRRGRWWRACAAAHPREAELRDHDVEGAELAAVAPEHVLGLDVEGRGGEPFGHPLHLGWAHEQEHGQRIDEAPDQPRAAIRSILDRKRVTQYCAAAPVTRGQLAIGTIGRPAGPSRQHRLERLGRHHPHAGAGGNLWLSFRPFWQTTTADRPAECNPAPSGRTSSCERRTEPGPAWGRGEIVLGAEAVPVEVRQVVGAASVSRARR